MSMKCVGKKLLMHIPKQNHIFLRQEALWGHEIMDLTKPLNKKVRELNINLNQKFCVT